MVEFGGLLELKNNGKSLNFQAHKVVAVAYKRWSFTRGSICKALTGKVLVHEFWIGGLNYGKWSLERWSFTRGSNCKALTGKVLVHEFWIGGLLSEVVAYERWSHMEVRLYHQLT